jgi:hypothetical protein
MSWHRRKAEAARAQGSRRGSANLIPFGGTKRYEFYACHDLPHRLPLNERIDAFAHLYNNY